MVRFHLATLSSPCGQAGFIETTRQHIHIPTANCGELHFIARRWRSVMLNSNKLNHSPKNAVGCSYFLPLSDQDTGLDETPRQIIYLRQPFFNQVIWWDCLRERFPWYLFHFANESEFHTIQVDSKEQVKISRLQ